MADVSNVQSSFLGGEWSPYASGRFDHKSYKSALASCLNSYPVPEGAWTRRTGFQFLSATKGGLPGRVIQFDFSETASYFMELTNNNIRLFAGNSHVYTDRAVVSAISAATPAAMTLGSAVGWSTADVIEFNFTSTTDAAQGAVLRDRQFIVTKVDTTHFTLADAITNAPLDGTTVNLGGAVVNAARILDLASTFTDAKWPDVRKVQAAKAGVPVGAPTAILLHGSQEPVALQAAVPAPVDPTLQQFTLATQPFLDGPYLDPVPGVTVQSQSTNPLDFFPDIVISDPSGAGPNGFVSTDVGRHMRFYVQPPLWDDSVAYTTGDYVTGPDGAYYANIVGGTGGGPPSANGAAWLPQSSDMSAGWGWAIITAVVSNVQVSIAFQPNTDSPQGLVYNFNQARVPAGAAPGVSPIRLWQLGAYSNTTGWPKCGGYIAGRLVLSGVIGNRVDFSEANNVFVFSPTSTQNVVGAGNAIAAVFNADNTNEVYWTEENSQGIAAGTRTGEWLISAPSGGGIAPNNISVARVTRVKAENILPVHTPLAMVFADKYAKELFEYFPEVFSGKMTAPNLNVFAKHLAATGIQELAYQSELLPIVWARNGDGSLTGCTYRRENSYGSEPPTFAGFHRHVLGGNHAVESITVGPGASLAQDTLRMVEHDIQAGVRHVTTLRPLFDQTSLVTAGWFVDDGVVPGSAKVTGAGITFYGMWHLQNHPAVSAVIGGVDCGDFTVAADGSVFVPYGPVFTLAYLQSIAGNYGDMTVTLDSPSIGFPAVFGLTYTSQGQRMRSIEPAEAGTANGAALAKTRRGHMYGVLFTGMVPGTVSIGTDFSHLRGITPVSPGNFALPTTSLYFGIWWATLDDSYSFDSQECWQITRPVPATIASMGWFGHGQDR